ncbi:hypothetical protein Tco_0192435, partial [Tanacetum coccineum]
MLDSKAYKEYYAVTFRAEPPKAKTKYKKKANEPVTPSTSKTAPASKGLVILSEVALTEAKQIKLATKRSKTPFHSSHASGLDDEDDVEESDLKDDSEETKSDDDGDNLTHPNLSTYKEDDKEEEQQKANDEEMYSDQRVSAPPEYELTKEEEENKEGDDKDKEGEQEQDEEDDLYRDVNINLERSDAEMTD